MRIVLGIDDLRHKLDGAELTFVNGKKYTLRFGNETNRPRLCDDEGAIPLHRGTIFKTSSLDEVEYI